MEIALKVWSDADLMTLPEDGWKRELLHGEIVMSPTGSKHGLLCSRLNAALEIHAQRKRLGVVFDSSTGFRLSPDDVLSPDAAFVAKARLKGQADVPSGFFPGAPDLVVEVLSPSDTLELVHAKMEMYFKYGCRLAWLVNPLEKSALVYRGGSANQLLKPGAVLEGEDVLPGFRLALKDLFADLSFG